MAVVWSGLAHILLHKPKTALQWLEEGLALQKESAVGYFTSWIYCFFGWCYLDLDDPEKARSYFEQAIAESQKNNEKHCEALSYVHFGRRLARSSLLEYAEAEDYINKGMKLFKQMKLKPYFAQGFLALGELFSRTGRKEEAREHLQKAESYFQQVGMKYWLNKTEEVLQRL